MAKRTKIKVNPLISLWLIIRSYPYILITSVRHPKIFVELTKEERSVNKAAIFLTINVLLIAVIRTITKIFYFKSGLLFLTALSATIFILPLIFFIVIAVTGLFHILAKLFDGRASFNRSFIAVCFSTMPLLFSQLPFAGVLLILYSLLLFALIFHKIHRFTFSKTVIVVFVPFIMVTVFLTLLGFINYGLIVRIFNLG